VVVVADTSPINYLILIDGIELLRVLYGHVLVPEAVALELRDQETPSKVRLWMQRLPDWMEIQGASPSHDPRLAELDPGEREAIELALQRGVSLVLMDETKGRRQAEQLHLRVRGTLGILEEAARLGKIGFLPALRKLEGTTFRMTDAVKAAAIRRART
jgi:predicted nucleic acid-binding protein